MKYITLPNGKAVSLGAYARAWRELKRLDPQTLVPGWSMFDTTAGGILREMREGLHDRINGPRSGRKYDPDWQRSVIYTARLLNGTRAVLDYVPKDLRTRLSHRLRGEGDDW